MNRTLKTILIWLLLAVLPLHAVAGSRMSCGQGSQQSIAAPASAGSQHHERLSDAHAHHEGGHAGQPAPSPAEAHPADGKSDKEPHTACSACSAFCLGAIAPPSAHLSVPAFDGSDAVVVTPKTFAVGFIQDGPQRPPRPHSA